MYEIFLARAKNKKGNKLDRYNVNYYYCEIKLTMDYMYIYMYIY